MSPDFIAAWSHSILFSTELFIWEIGSLYSVILGFHIGKELLSYAQWTPQGLGALYPQSSCVGWSQFPGPVLFYLPPAFLCFQHYHIPKPTFVQSHVLPWAPISGLLLSKPGELTCATGWMISPCSIVFWNQVSSPCFQPSWPQFAAMCFSSSSLNFNMHVKHLGILLK